MSKKTYYNFAAGWEKQKDDGTRYISCKVNEAKDKFGAVKIQAVNENGETLDIDNFVVLYNDKERDSHPDVRFSFSTED